MNTLEPQPGGGWISGAMRDGASARDTRPEYSPTALILDVQRALSAAGVRVDADRGMLSTAVIAAADLLRALGVRPASVPTLRPRGDCEPRCTKGDPDAE